MKKCPHCAEDIQADAKVCRFCNRELAPAASASVPPDELARRRKLARKFVMLVAVLIAVGYAIKVISEPLPSRRVQADGTVATVPASSQPPQVPFVFTAGMEDGQIIISNISSADWTDVALELNGGAFSDGFIYRIARLDSLKSVKVGTLLFAKPDGTRFNVYQMKPQTLRVRARVEGRPEVRTVAFQ